MTIDDIDEDWLRIVGFKWHQFDRQPHKQWLLWIGDAMAQRMTSCEDIGIELAPSGWAGDPWWFCWLRGDSAGRYHRFIHVRHVSTQRDVIRLFEGLTGKDWNPENHYCGCARTSEQMAYIRRENERIDRKGKWPTWSEIENDDTRSRSLPEHMQSAIDLGGAK